MSLLAIFKEEGQIQCQDPVTYMKKFLGGKHSKYSGLVKVRVVESISSGIEEHEYEEKYVICNCPSPNCV